MSFGSAALKKDLETWYRLPVEITVTANHLHRVQFAGLTLPHPGVVNWISRRGHPLATRLELTALHEYGHLQTLPVPILHLLFVLWPRDGAPTISGWRRLVGILLSHQVIWEIASEAYVATHDRRATCGPRSRQDKTLYAIFWGGMALLGLWSTRQSIKR